MGIRSEEQKDFLWLGAVILAGLSVGGYMITPKEEKKNIKGIIGNTAGLTIAACAVLQSQDRSGGWGMLTTAPIAAVSLLTTVFNPPTNKIVAGGKKILIPLVVGGTVIGLVQNSARESKNRQIVAQNEAKILADIKDPLYVQKMFRILQEEVKSPDTYIGSSLPSGMPLIDHLMYILSKTGQDRVYEAILLVPRRTGSNLFENSVNSLRLMNKPRFQADMLELRKWVQGNTENKEILRKRISCIDRVIKV